MRMLLLFVIYMSVTFFKTIGQPRETIESFRSKIVSFGVVSKMKIFDSLNNFKLKEFYDVVGSGIVCYVPYKDDLMLCVVTAKHVLYDPKIGYAPRSLKIRFANKDTLSVTEYLGEDVMLYTSKGESYWFPHPDSTVDLVCLPLSEGDNFSFVRNGHTSISTLSYSSFANENDLYESKSILCAGFPGVVGSDYLTRAIFRNGIIAWTSPKKPELNNFLIDCNVFPGNSGGPVFVNNGILPLGDSLSLRFAGIVIQKRRKINNVFNEKMDVIKDGLGKVVFSEESIGIGIVVPYGRVQELLNAFMNAIK
ncbi:V8-like Glu-specific endopeptidase [Filimonas lacunae]|uniref:V8-like Glu-specific endopeptidase n=1 Tax=Filimonas lacunae TaxID=477680 RepID=A0A173MHC6_9BACT|nr:serine protease [Filimonas lacunae]BAV07013.1 hypothetical protein FLA_3033 [Filimonas lacunae]SIS96359.1 V8-like Glu-specific endopeptidase [Filimonas lacunae]